MKITYDFLKLAISKCFSTPLFFLESALIAKLLGPSVFGQWSLIIAAASMLHSIIFSWSHAITIKFGTEEWAQHRSLNQTLNVRIPLVMIGLLICLFLLWYQPLGWLTKAFSIPSYLSWLVLFSTVSLWLTLEAQSYLQATERISHQALLVPLITAVSIGFLLVSIYIGNRSLLIVGFGIAIIKSLFWGGRWLLGLKRIHFHWQFPTYSNIRNALIFSWPILPTLMLGYLSDWGDHLLLGLYCTSKEVGLWGVSYQLMLGVISINSILVTVLLPWLSKNQYSLETAKNFLRNIMPTVLSVWILAVTVFVMVLPNLFLFIMGAQFKEASKIVLILNTAILTNAFSSLYGLLFNIENRLRAGLLYNASMVVVNFSVSMLLIPKMGIEGAAWGTLISYLVGHSLYLIDQHVFLKVSLDKMGMLFFVVLFVGVLQYFAGINLWVRIFCCLFSLFFLIITVRRKGNIQPMIIAKFFTGVLNPAGLFLQRMLVRIKIHEYT